jgi:hypothetical protein
MANCERCRFPFRHAVRSGENRHPGQDRRSASHVDALQKWVSETYDDLFLTLSELSVLVNGESDVVGRIRFPELEDRLFLAILKRVANKQVDLAASVSQRSLPERRCSNDQSPWARGCWRGDRPQRFGLLNLPIQIPSWYR